MPFIAAAVPTGIKIGVWITPWSVVITPARAADAQSLYWSSNFILILKRTKVQNNFEF
jgi:hypothetical protein